jgi:Na+/melibiose symporter-like transporter
VTAFFDFIMQNKWPLIICAYGVILYFFFLWPLLRVKNRRKVTSFDYIALGFFAGLIKRQQEKDQKNGPKPISMIIKILVVITIIILVWAIKNQSEQCGLGGEYEGTKRCISVK